MRDLKRSPLTHYFWHARTEMSSCATEEVTEWTQLFEDIMIDMDKTSEWRRRGRQERTQKDNELKDSGENIRAQALGTLCSGLQPYQTQADDSWMTIDWQQQRSGSAAELIFGRWGVRMDFVTSSPAECCSGRRKWILATKTGNEESSNWTLSTTRGKTGWFSTTLMKIESRYASKGDKGIELDAEEPQGVWEECKHVLSILDALVKKLF